MSRSEQRHAASYRGFSLVELMVTMTILGVVLGAVFYTFFRSQASARQTENIVEARQGSRAALQLIERELRMAGSGWGRVPVYGSLNGAPLTLYAIDPAPCSAGSDSLILLGAWEANTTLRAPMATTTSDIRCVSTQGFNVNNYVLVTNGSSAHFFQATGVSGSPADIQHASSSIYNMPGGHANWPAGGYGTGARVYRVAWITYNVDPSTFRTPCLVRREQGGTPLVVATNVSAFHVWYLLQDDTVTRDPANLSIIDRVRPVVETQVATRNMSTVTDSVWTMVRPRTF